MITPLRIIAILCTLVLPSLTVTQAEEPCPASRNSELDDWYSECFEMHGTIRQVKKKHLHKLRFNKYGFATIGIIEGLPEIVAVNKKGIVVIPGIRWGSRDYPSSPGGVSRFYTRDDYKCGYFKLSNFSIIVPAIYDNCLAFWEGEGIACNNCVGYRSSWDFSFGGYYGNDSSFTFNKSGKLIKKEPSPRVEDACEEGFIPKIKDRDGGQILDCTIPSCEKDTVGTFLDLPGWGKDTLDSLEWKVIIDKILGSGRCNSRPKGMWGVL